VRFLYAKDWERREFKGREKRKQGIPMETTINRLGNPGK